ncbi:MAG: N-acetyltransferase [Mucilaginibacter sp.]|nr:N-acetyltransferase [Mucilaginibacter sp.]
MKNIKDELQNIILGNEQIGPAGQLKKVQVFLRGYAGASCSAKEQQHLEGEETALLIFAESENLFYPQIIPEIDFIGEGAEQRVYRFDDSSVIKTNRGVFMAIIATIEKEEYLVDLGFGGDGIRAPVKLSQLESVSKQGSETFSLMKTADNEYILKSLNNNEWRPLYSFNLHPQRWIDFKPANYFNPTHADSLFVQNLLVVLQNPLGKKYYSAVLLSLS